MGDVRSQPRPLFGGQGGLQQIACLSSGVFACFKLRHVFPGKQALADFRLLHLVGPGGNVRRDGGPRSDQRNGRKHHRQQRLAQQPPAEDLEDRATAALLDRGLPTFRFGNEKHDKQRQQGRAGADDHHPTPIGLGYLPRERNQSNEEETEVGRRADGPGQLRPVPLGPTFHDQRYAQRPLASHPQRRNEQQQSEMPRLLGKVAAAHEKRVGQHAEDHRPNAADLVAQPTERRTRRTPRPARSRR